MAIAPFLQYPAVAIRIAEVGEAGIVSVRRVEPRSETPIPRSDRGLVADFTDRDAAFEQVAARGLEVRDHEIGVADGAGRRVRDSVTDLNRTAGARRGELRDAEGVIRRVVDVEREANLIDVEPQRSLDIAHWQRDHFD